MSGNVSLLGIRYNLKNGSPAYRILWIIVICIAAFCSVYHLYRLCIIFKQLSTTTNIKTITTNKQSFPDVTFCNLNHLRQSLVAQNSIYAVIGGLKSGKIKQYVRGGQVVFKLLENMGIEQILDQINSEIKAIKSHQLEHMLLSCTFNSIPCDFRNFTATYNYDYGNCYTFKPVNRLITQAGSKQGLSLEIYVQLNEYIRKFSDTVGLKILIHPENTEAFPTEKGFIVTPGFHTQIGFKKKIISHVKPPYGNCHASGDKNNNSKYQRQSNFSYSVTACSRNCIENHLMTSCHCYHPKYSTKSTLHHSTLITKCHSGCSDKLIQLYEDNILCIEECPSPCSETNFNFQTSFGLWPLEDQIEPLMSKYQNILREGGLLLPSDMYDADHHAKKEFFRNNFVKVKVFYNHLHYHLTENHSSYSWFTFLADIGGQASLWLGFSFLSIFQIIELIFAMCQKTDLPSESDKMQASSNTTATNEFLV